MYPPPARPFGGVWDLIVARTHTPLPSKAFHNLTRSGAVLLVAACAGTARIPVRADGATPVPTPPPLPRLVVAVVLDQMGSEALVTLGPLLEGGAFARARREGRVLDQVVYAYAATLTAPGHAAIFTGATPRVSGVTSNHVVDRKTGLKRAVVDDGEHGVLGVAGAFAGPGVLRVDTVADALELATGGKSKTVALALKDRSAVLPAGKRGDVALFYDARVGFTTSTYYAAELPAWLLAFAQAHPINPAAVRWDVPDPERLSLLLGPDAAPGEADYKGLGTVFPHVLAGDPDAAELWSYTPDSTEYLLDLAYEAAVQLDLGADDVPDLLMVSVSGTDYTGHVFGPDSWEYADHLRRADRAVLRLYERLAARTRVAMLVTSDHGAARLPERVHDALPTATRIDATMLAAAVDAELDTALGPGDWVSGYLEPYLFLTEAARTHPDAARARKLALDAVARQPGIAAAYDSLDAAKLGQEHRELATRAYESIDPERSGDVLVIVAQGAVPDIGITKGAGTTHGSPWSYDTHVPVWMLGAGVSAGHDAEPLEQARVASTLCALLGIAPPTAAVAAPLPGARAR